MDQALALRLQIHSGEDPGLKALSSSVATTHTRSLSASKDAGSRPKTTSVTLHPCSQDVFRLLKSLFCSVPVEKVFLGIFGLPLVAHHRDPQLPSSMKKHQGWCWGSFEPTYTTFCFLGSHPDTAEGLGGQITAGLHSWSLFSSISCSRVLQGLLCSPEVCCSDCSGQTFLSRSSREQMPQEGMETLLRKARNDCFYRGIWSIYY